MVHIIIGAATISALRLTLIPEKATPENNKILALQKSLTDTLDKAEQSLATHADLAYHLLMNDPEGELNMDETKLEEANKEFTEFYEALKTSSNLQTIHENLAETPCRAIDYSMSHHREIDTVINLTSAATKLALTTALVATGTVATEKAIQKLKHNTTFTNMKTYPTFLKNGLAALRSAPPQLKEHSQ